LLEPDPLALHFDAAASPGHALMTQTITKQRLPNHWLVAGGGVPMQLALGVVYAWSVFRDPLMKSFGWPISEITRDVDDYRLPYADLQFTAFARAQPSRPGSAGTRRLTRSQKKSTDN
jgi:hypothetical protein